LHARPVVKTCWILSFAAVLGIGAIVACREGAPSGDPKTPANSPIPEIDRKEPDPTRAPSLNLSDAG
jgi:hypothetical protein